MGTGLTSHRRNCPWSLDCSRRPLQCLSWIDRGIHWPVCCRSRYTAVVSAARKGISALPVSHPCHSIWHCCLAWSTCGLWGYNRFCLDRWPWCHLTCWSCCFHRRGFGSCSCYVSRAVVRCQICCGIYRHAVIRIYLVASGEALFTHIGDSTVKQRKV